MRSLADWENAQVSAVDRLWGIIPAGGAGTRLWPLSRAASPKFLHDLTGTGRTLLQATADRLEPLVGRRLIVVTGHAHAPGVRRQLPDLATLLAEPSPRDSMAAIAWAAATVERNHPDGLIGSFAADHVIPETASFTRCIAEAAALADTGVLVTIGIEPTSPATGFGYIRTGEELVNFDTARVVREFVEKPDAATAAAYVASGEYLWNAGMFLCRAAVLLDLLAQEHPELAAAARQLAATPERLEEIWPTLTKIAIDHAIAEPAAARGQVAVVPGDFTWDDVGDFEFLGRLLPSHDGLQTLGDPAQVLAVDASGLVVAGGGRFVGVLGLDDVVVVDTPDAILVTTKARAQEVKAVVERLRSLGREDLL